MWVEVVFMMFILKLPVIYVCWLVWWAVRAEPRPLEGAAVTADDEPSPWRRSPCRPPRGGPVRSYSRRGSREARVEARR